jgi:PAS domain S-box-containing protein
MNILIVEDNEDTVLLLSEKLKSTKYECTFAYSLQETIDKINKKRYDAIILDLNLPDSTGLDTFRTVLKECVDCPIIIFTVLEDDYTTIQAIHEGAQDYLIKAYTNEDIIIRTVRYAIERKNIENKLKKTIEEKQQYHDAYLDADGKFRAIINYTNDLIWTVDKEGCYTFLNKAAEKISGYTNKELSGQCYEPLLPKEELPRVINIFNNILAGQPQTYEFTFVNTKKENRIISVTGTPLYKKGNVIGVANIGRDITESKKTERQLKNTKEKLERSNKELSEFVHIASHDLQQPIRTIVTYVDLLINKYKETCPLDRETKEYIDIILSSSIHMQDMIDDLLALSKIERKGKPFLKTNIQKVLEQVMINLHNFIAESSAKITIGEMPLIFCDETQFIQLFQNLIDNAIKFSKMGFTPEINITAEREKNEHWVFSVTDNGIGIASKNFDQLFIIFNRLHTDEYPGTGVGLIICKKIVERHNGRIWIESELGKGSSFKFSIPIKEDRKNGKNDEK